MSNTNAEQKMFIADKIIPFLKQNRAADIFSNEILYMEYCALYGYSLNVKYDKSSPEYKKILSHLNKINYRHCSDLGTTEDLKNEVVVQTVKSTEIKKNILNQKSQDAHAGITIKETKVESQYRLIKKVQFSSPITRDAIEKLELQMQNYKQLKKDYLYYLGGGTDLTEEVSTKVLEGNQKVVKKIVRNRHQFPSLGIKAKFQNQLQEMLKKPNLMTINKEVLENVKKQYELAVKMEQSPIEFMNMIAEGGFNLQKELQGAILNDKAMVENGIVELEPEEKPLTAEDIEETAKSTIKYADNPQFKEIIEKMSETI